MQITQRLQALKGSPTAQVKQTADRLKREGVRVYDFGVGEPDFPTPDPIKQAAQRAMADNRTTYTAARGILELRQAIAERYNRRYGADFGPEHVIATVGAKQALYNLMQALVDPGDEVLLPAPYWVTYPAQIELAGGKTVVVPTEEQDGFAVTARALESHLTDRTRAVILNSPSNPTGATISESELKAITELTAARGVALVYDECYECFVYDGAHHNPFSWGQDHVFSVSSVSKTYAMTGWRVGWTVGPEDVVAAMDRLQSQSTSNPTSIAQWAALEALTGDQGAVGDMLEAYRARRRLVVEKLCAIRGLSCAEPSGAFYAFPNVSGFFNDRFPDSVALSTYLLEEAHTAVVPGTGFGAEGYVRLSYAAPNETLATGLDRIKAALEKL